MRPDNSRPTAQWALVSWLFSLLTLETLDSITMFAGGLAAALMEEAATWLVHGGVLAFVLAANTYFLPPLPHLCPHHADLFIDPVEFHESARRISGLGTRCRGSRSGLTFDTRLFFLEDPTTLFTTTFVRFCDESHVLSRFGDAGYVLGYPSYDSHDLIAGR